MAGSGLLLHSHNQLPLNIYDLDTALFLPYLNLRSPALTKDFVEFFFSFHKIHRRSSRQVINVTEVWWAVTSKQSALPL